MGIKPSQVIDDLLEITNADSLGRDLVALVSAIKADLDSSNFTFSADTLRLLNEAKEFVPDDDDDDEDEDWEDDFPDEEDDLED